MSGVRIDGYATWHNLLHVDVLILTAPGLICGVALMLIVNRFHGPAVLPSCTVAQHHCYAA